MKNSLRNHRVFLSAIVLTLGFLNPAAAFTNGQCGDFSPEISLVACTQMIATGSFGSQKKWDVFRNRGNAFAKLNNYKLAIADFNERLKRLGNRDSKVENDARSMLLNQRGESKNLNDDKSGALEDFAAAIENNPDNSEPYFQRGRLNFKNRDYAAAIEDFTRAIEHNPEGENSFYWRASSNDELGNFDEAIADYNQAIALYPQDESYYFDRGLTYKR